MSDRIVIDPDELRDVAVRARGTGELYGSVARSLSSRPLPLMPPALGALVNESIARINVELHDLAAELVEESRSLLARAAWVELGEAAAPAWLIPTFGRYAVMGSRAPDRTGEALAAAGDQELAGMESWALELLDRMGDRSGLCDADGSGSGDVMDPALIELVARHAEGSTIEPVEGLRFALSGTVGVHESMDPVTSLGAGMTEAMGTATGALGTALVGDIEGASGVGIVGCLAIGAGVTGLVDEQLEDLDRVGPLAASDTGALEEPGSLVRRGSLGGRRSLVGDRG